MPYAIAELIAILVMVFMLGSFILLFPLSRRLGKVMEEWIKIRHETSPDRDLLARVEVELVEIRNQVDGMDQRLDFLAERQDFLESLAEARKIESLAQGQGGRD